MTAEKLYAILSFLDDLDKTLGLQANLESVSSTVNDLVTNPAHPSYQQTLATSLDAFSASANRMRLTITPSQMAAIKQLGGEELFAPGIADKVRESVQLNAMTPSVTRDFVTKLASRRQAFMTTVRAARQNLIDLGITESKLKPDSADVAFIIPREIFDNHLDTFASELKFISRLMQDFSEAVTGERKDVVLEQLSSSIPTVSILAAPIVLGVLADVVNKYLDAWKKIEEIRTMRAKLNEMGLKGTALEELTERVQTTVDETVEESTQVIIKHYTREDHGRRNELENAIRKDAHRLFGQIERGLKLEFRAEPKADGEGKDQEAIKKINDLSKVIQFPEPAREPMLLPGGEIIEGEIKTKKTKSTTTTTTTKKEPKSEEKK